MMAQLVAETGGRMDATKLAPEVERSARSLLPALDTIAGSEVEAARNADRYAMRLRFALARVAELRASTERLGGVFESARLDVALSILETHERRAAYFVASITAPAVSAKTAVRRKTTVTSAAIIADDEPAAERRAA
jgi:hypothetical protein